MNFDRVLALVKYCRVLLSLQVFIHLYRGRKRRCRGANASKSR